MSDKKSWRISLVIVLVLMLVVGSTLTGLASASQWSFSRVWDGRGMDSEDCDLIGTSPERTADGWIHWVFSTKGRSTDAELVLGGSGSGTYQPAEPLNARVWHFYTPYFELDELTATIHLNGRPGPGGGLVISDYCPGAVEELTVSKTVETSFVREHEWDIEKSVETENEYTIDGVPKIWLYIDGSGDETATWKVDVTYEGFEDSNFNVSGAITIENTGSLDAVITDVVDELAGEPIVVDFGVEFPYTLPVGETLVGTYDEDVDEEIEGFNEVTVTTERDEYFGDAEIIWEGPTSQINETITIEDDSDLLGVVELGTVTAPNNAEFTYREDFAYFVGAESAVYDNTATIVETGQSADARLKVNVQEFVFEGETAWAANGNVPGEFRYENPGNWATYVEYNGVEKTTTLFAGQNINAGTVNFSAPVNDKVTITVHLAGDWEFKDVAEYLKVQDYEFAPSGNPAPGLFDHKVSSGKTIVVPENNFYGVHLDVGRWVPDPDFGP